MNSHHLETSASKVSEDGIGAITEKLVKWQLSSKEEEQVFDKTKKAEVKTTHKQSDGQGNKNNVSKQRTHLQPRRRIQNGHRISPTKLALAAKSEQPAHKNLLVLDLNGTLLIRNKKTKAIYLRPHVPEFIDFILDKFSVLIWSSAMPDNVDRMVAQVFDQRHSLLLDVWNRTYLRLSREAYHQKVEVIKDLSWVWEKHPHWNGTNTILIDDTPFKGQLQPFNHICLSEFVRDRKDDTELLRVKTYLEAMLNADTDDIREYTKKHKYALATPAVVEE